MAKKKQQHEEHPDEAWLLPYADMLTLLLALFIVMFAMSQVNEEKLKKVSKSFNVVFSGGSGVMPSDGNTLIEDLVSSNEVIEQDKMVSAKNILEEEIKQGGYEGQINVEINGEGLLISMQDTVLFNSGHAEILSEFHPALTEISNIIKGFDNKIRISGHTDNVPIKNSRFNDNWELSSSRSLNVMYFMINNGKIAQNKFSIEANGEFNPRFDNSTPDGQAKNRRVEVLLLRNHPVDDKKLK